MNCIIILMGAVVLVCSLFLIKRYLKLQSDKKIKENQENIAATLIKYSNHIRKYTDKVSRHKQWIIQYDDIRIPPSRGYRVTIELRGLAFRVSATPEIYDKTGRLSFYIDQTLVIRALDKSGEAASQNDPEYKDNLGPAEEALPSQIGEEAVAQSGEQESV